MRRVRVGLFASSWALGVLLVGASAVAQPKAPSGGPSRSSTQYTMRREEAGGADAQTARARARAGDCAAALSLFDAAIHKTIEPTLRRDRGLCHEKLGNVFPAIDDYRTYLTAQPDAPDADQVRQRLAVLEGQSGGASSAASEGGQEPTAAGEASASVAVGSSGVKASTSASSSKDGASASDASLTYDQRVAKEKSNDEAQTSPLRYGSGVVLGPFVHMPRFFFGERAREALSYGVGLALRYSTGRLFSIISELGYAGIGTSGASSSQAGPLLFGGVELRLPLTPFGGDHAVLRGGLGYERYVSSGTRAVNNTLLGRVAVGYRHVFGPSVAVEFLADGGPAYVIPETGSSRLNVVVGGSAAFLVGF